MVPSPRTASPHPVVCGGVETPTVRTAAVHALEVAALPVRAVSGDRHPDGRVWARRPHGIRRRTDGAR
jgi:hypothetical protein